MLKFSISISIPKNNFFIVEFFGNLVLQNRTSNSPKIPNSELRKLFDQTLLYENEFHFRGTKKSERDAVFFTEPLITYLDVGFFIKSLP